MESSTHDARDDVEAARRELQAAENQVRVARGRYVTADTGDILDARAALDRAQRRLREARARVGGVEQHAALGHAVRAGEAPGFSSGRMLRAREERQGLLQPRGDR